MENTRIARVGALFGKGKYGFLFFVLLCLSFLFYGCASSDISRDAAANIDMGVQNAKNLAGGAGDTNIADSYQNASQTTKGALIGGAAGAITGALASGVGVIPGTATGAILGAAYGAYIDTYTTKQDQLENRGVTVVILGDQILIVMPSMRIFDAWTARIKPQAYSTLALVTRIINKYTKMLVKVAAYTDDTGSKSFDLSLSQQQADAVAKFLLESGVDARVLYSSGYGGQRLVVKNSGDWNSDNYRIEITLEKLYV